MSKRPKDEKKLEISHFFNFTDVEFSSSSVLMYDGLTKKIAVRSFNNVRKTLKERGLLLVGPRSTPGLFGSDWVVTAPDNSSKWCRHLESRGFGFVELVIVGNMNMFATMMRIKKPWVRYVLLAPTFQPQLTNVIVSQSDIFNKEVRAEMSIYGSIAPIVKQHEHDLRF